MEIQTTSCTEFETPCFLGIEVLVLSGVTVGESSTVGASLFLYRNLP
jgi:acetyltransferase-like isoleucine patch superfamily enzyme